MTFSRYLSYRESGVELIGDVPSHWAIVRVKDFAEIVNGFPFDSKLFNRDAGMPLLRIRDLNAKETEVRYSGEVDPKFLVTDEDLLVGMDGDFNVGRWRGSDPALLNQRVCAIRVESKIISRLLEYTLPMSLKRINDLTYSTTVKHLSSSQVEQTRLALPTIPGEIANLVAFLDRETMKIDALVEEQKRLIALLKEKRQAVISHAVTKGINPDARMKDSGVEWLGEVPEHWEIVPIRRCFQSVDYGISETLQPYGEIAVLRMGNIQDGKVVLNDLRYIDNVERSLLLQNDDLLYNRTNSLDLIGKVGRYEIRDDQPVTFASYLVRCRTSENCDPGFMSYALNAEGLLGAARARAFVAIGQCNLNPKRYGEIPIARPPLEEQITIAAYLKDQTDSIGCLRQACESAISLLQERRSAMISAAVTGKIDVRGLVPDQVEAA